jgi:hypothetical protein
LPSRTVARLARLELSEPLEALPDRPIEVRLDRDSKATATSGKGRMQFSEQLVPNRLWLSLDVRVCGGQGDIAIRL